jgi:hypothetical protein
MFGEEEERVRAEKRSRLGVRVGETSSETDSDAGVGIALTERPRTSALEALPTGVGACVFACLDAGDHTVLASASRLLARVSQLPAASCPTMRLVSRAATGLPMPFRLRPRHLTVQCERNDMMCDAAFYACVAQLEGLALMNAENDYSYVPAFLVPVLGALVTLRSLTVDTHLENDWRDPHGVSLSWWTMLASLPALTRLNVSELSVTGPYFDVPGSGPLTALRELLVASVDSRVSTTFFPALQRLSTAGSGRGYGQRYLDPELVRDHMWAMMPRLESLTVSDDARFCRQGCAFLGRYQHLTELHLRDGIMTTTDVAHVAHLTLLAQLTLGVHACDEPPD